MYTGTLPIEPSYLRIGVGLSLLVHLLLAYLIQDAARSTLDFDAVPISVSVSYISEAPTGQIERQQMVAPPEKAEEVKEPPAEARLLSERNLRVPKEQVKRGDGPDAGPKPSTAPKQAAMAKASAQRPEQEEAAPKTLKHLLLDKESVDKLAKKAPASGRMSESLDDIIRQDPSTAIASTAGYQPFSRPFGSGARFLGVRGSSDYLPHLPDGDITLLNTKANRFAVFVRRVAEQVFSQLRSSGWEFLRAQDVASIGEDCEVHAAMSLKGELLDVRLSSPSGSVRFDEILRESVKSGAKDPNPPPEAAASDGTIRFIFKARSWVRFTSDPRTGAPSERRWLLLATGLE